VSGYDSNPAAGSTPPATIIRPMSRRSMLLRTAGAGAAGLTAASLLGGTAMAAARPADGTGADAQAGPDSAGPDICEPVVARIRDARSGEIDIFRGTTHTQIRDPQLAALLARAAR
jgi:hypothetical protein